MSLVPKIIIVFCRNSIERSYAYYKDLISKTHSCSNIMLNCHKNPFVN
jgi:hypothetical protein